MKQTVKKVIVGIMAMATITAFFTGCSGNQSDPDISSSTSTTSTSADITPGVPISDNEFSVQFAYWYDSIKESFDNKFEATEKKLLSSIPIYADSTGNEFIVSGREAIPLADGQLTYADLYHNLREAGTGERYYLTYGDPDTCDTSKFKALLEQEANNAQSPETYEERTSSDNRLTLADSVEYKVFLNNMDTGLTYKLTDNRIELYPSLVKYGLAKFESKPAEATATLNLYTGAGQVNIAISETPEGIYEWSYQEPGSDTYTKKGYANKNDFAFTESSFFLSPDKIQTLLGYDIDVYGTFINIVTDNKDLADSNRLVAAGPEEILAVVEPPAPSEPSTSEPTSDTSEPTTSEPTSDTSEPTSSSSSTPTEPTTSSSTTSPPTQSTSSSTPTQSTSSTPTAAPITKYWNPDAPGNKPGPYGGYYDASGKLHCLNANMPRDDKDYPLKSYEDEYGTGHLTYEEKEEARRREEAIAAGNEHINESDFTEEGRNNWGW